MNLETISHYRIVKKLGSGGMGEVYLAEDVKLSRPVALKVLPHGEESESRLRRFAREAHAASILSHPHIAHLYEIGEEGDLHYIAMEYVEGKQLDDYIGGRPLPVREIVTFAIQIADALEEAHAKGIVHRDVKPSNIMITQRGVKILDFGLAKLNPSEKISRPEGDTMLQTSPGMLAGTPPYMSPEQALGHEVGPRSDLFSLGVVLYQMCTGRLPFAGSSTIATLQLIIGSHPAAMARFNYDLPTELERIVLKCLEKDAERRYQTAKELLVDLRNLDRNLNSDSAKELLDVRSVPGAPKVRRPLLAVAGVAVLAALTGLALWKREPAARPGTPARKIESLAVLPLVNLSRDPAQDFFADGITEGLTANLARIGSLHVISRTSAMQYKGARKPIPRIARELNVDAIVEGSVMRSGGRVRITAQLIDASADRHLWSQTFDRRIEDILDLQRDLTMSIAKEIQAQLTPQQRTHFATLSPVNPRAYELYLKAQQHKSQFEFSKSVELLEEAIRIDPKFAPAYAELAETQMAGMGFGNFPLAEASAQAKAAATKALELDGTLPEAHMALGSVKLLFGWDLTGAEESVRRALELSPSNVEAHSRISMWAGILGDHRTMVAEAIRARELAPLDIGVSHGLAEAYIFAGKYAEAVQECRRVLELRDTFFFHEGARLNMGHALMHLKKFREALPLIEVEPSKWQTNLGKATLLVHCYLLAGEPARAREIFEFWSKKPAEPSVSPFEMAMLFSVAGEKDVAFRWLDEAYRRHDSWLLFTKLLETDIFEPIRSDPRYNALLAKIGLPLSKS